MEEAVHLGRAADIVTASTPSTAASLAALEIFLSILGSIVTVFGVFLPLGEAVTLVEEELAYEQLVGGILAGGLGGRRGPGGRSGTLAMAAAPTSRDRKASPISHLLRQTQTRSDRLITLVLYPILPIPMEKVESKVETLQQSCNHSQMIPRQIQP